MYIYNFSDNIIYISFAGVLNKLTAAGIPAKDIHGTRVPQLVVGDNWQFIGKINKPPRQKTYL